MRRAADLVAKYSTILTEPPQIIHDLMTCSLMWKKVNYLLARRVAVRNDPTLAHCPSFLLCARSVPGAFLADNAYAA